MALAEGSGQPTGYASMRWAAHARDFARIARIVSFCALVLVAISCAREPKSARPADEDIALAAGQPEAPAIAARRAGIEAARTGEGSAGLMDEVELRVSDDYVDEHQIRVAARVPLRRPAETRAHREMVAAEVEMAESRLDEAALTLRADQCFPSVDAQARAADEQMYLDWAARQDSLLAYNDEGRRSGLISEIDASRFELSSRLRLATREPMPAPPQEARAAALPLLLPSDPPLDRSDTTLMQAVRRHHPSVALHHATAARYEAMAGRARSRGRPWVKFVELRYEHQTGESNGPGRPNDPSVNGGGARVSFTVPFGGDASAEARRYSALVREQRSEAEALVADRTRGAALALEELHAFEARVAGLRELLNLADEADAIADRWWRSKLASPNQIANLLDEAFAARSAVLDARERAGIARCTLLTMTGVAAEDWPRESPDGLEPRRREEGAVLPVKADPSRVTP